MTADFETCPIGTLARIRELEEAAYHLRLARDAWNFDQTQANFKILGEAMDRLIALNARG